MQIPILTVVVPSYNVESYLEKGLSTFADARFDGRLEVLVVDDGSKDATPQIAQRFVDEHSRIFRLIRKENGGHGSVINVGIAEAKGTYFRVVDGDDWVNTDALARLLDVLAATEADIIVDERTDVDMATGDEALVAIDISAKPHVTVALDELCEEPYLEHSLHIHALTVRTELLREHGIRLLENTFYEDYEYMCKVLALAKTIRFEKLPVYCYLRGNAQQSVSDSNYVRHWDDHVRVTREVLRFYAEDAEALSERRRSFLERKIPLFINTGYSIALIFDHDRKRGAQRAKDYRAFLLENHPGFAERTNGRYHKAKLLHMLGIDSQKKLDKFMGRG